MPQYTTLEAVKKQLIGKVRFTDDPDDDNKMFEGLAETLIDEAEGIVEYDLSPRYATPFMNVDGGDFSTITQAPTPSIIRMLCELKAIDRILGSDYGSGTAVDGENYQKDVQKRYSALIKRILAKKKDRGQEAAGWMYPPLPQIALAYFNTEADDGYHGAVIVASGSPSLGYAAHQINNPAFGLWNGLPYRRGRNY